MRDNSISNNLYIPNSQDFFWLWVFGPSLIFYGCFLVSVNAMRTEHWLVFSLILFLNYFPKTRPSFKLLFPVALFAIIYDALRFITPYAHAKIPIHVAEPYRLELKLFGLKSADGFVIPCKFFENFRFVGLDLAAAFAYSFFIFESILAAFIWSVKDKVLMQRFGWTFLITNLLGFITYYTYPAAPPWYVLQHGFGPAILNTPGNPAHLAVVDQFLGINYFHNYYAHSSNVFAAIPSMHVAYPLLVWLFGRQHYPKWDSVLMSFWLLVCFSAVYLGHHYVIDVLLGCTYAFITYKVVNIVFDRLKPKTIK